MRKLAFLLPIAVAVGCFVDGNISAEPLRTVDAALSPVAAAQLCSAPSDSCQTDADCAPVGSTPRFCTRTWNKDLELVWKTRAPGFGHCVDPSGVVPSNAAIQADLCALPEPREYSLGIPYKLPPDAVLLFSDIGMKDEEQSRSVGLTVFQRTILDGNGSTVLVPTTPANFVAINVVVSLVGNGYAAPTGHANNSTLQNLALRPTVVSNAVSSTGILVRAHGVRLHNIRANNLGTCIQVDGQHGAVAYNANNSRWSNILLEKCRTYAAKLGGHDTNAGYFAGVEVLDGVGVVESSFATSTWVGYSAEASSLPTNDPTAPPGTKHVLSVEGTGHTIVGPHLESQPVYPTSNGTILWVGGNGPLQAPDGAERVGYGRSRLIFAPAAGIKPDGTYGALDGNSAYKVIIPGTAGQKFAISMQDRPNETVAWQFKAINGVWGIYSEGNDMPFGWRQSNVVAERGKFTLGRKSISETGSYCCDGIDNDGNGLKDSQESTCQSAVCQ